MDKAHTIVDLTNIHDFPELKKYYAQRFRYFTKYEQGIKLDYDMWFSVTPETIAKHVAQQVYASYGETKNLTILDAFTGAGSNAIHFAALDKSITVTAIDIDEKRLDLAKHNAKVYGVEDRITFIHGDFMKIGKSLKQHDVTFLSPPWGGPEYMKGEYSMKTMLKFGIDVQKLFELCAEKSSSVIHFVPRNTNARECMELCRYFDTNRVRLEKQYFGKKFKTLCCYYGKMAQ